MDCRSEMKFLVNDAGGGREMWDVMKRERLFGVKELEEWL